MTTGTVELGAGEGCGVTDLEGTVVFPDVDGSCAGFCAGAFFGAVFATGFVVFTGGTVFGGRSRGIGDLPRIVSVGETDGFFGVTAFGKSVTPGTYGLGAGAFLGAGGEPSGL